MVIGIEFNRIKTPSGKTFYRVAPYLNNVDKLKVGVTAIVILAVGFLVGWSMLVNAQPQDNSHIKPWTSYNAQ